VARVVLHLELSSQFRLIRTKTITETVAITSPMIEATALAMAQALERAVDSAAEWVVP
jgi:hypothetical protein